MDNSAFIQRLNTTIDVVSARDGEQCIYPENRDKIDVVSARDGEQCIYPEIRDKIDVVSARDGYHFCKLIFF